MAILFIIAFGLIIGSFLTVCIFRIPAGRNDLIKDPFTESGEEKPLPEVAPSTEKISILYPKRSFCPECKAQLSWYENIPLFSWIAQGGKCRHCKKPISSRYPIVEALTALSALLTFTQYGITPTGFLIFVFVCSLIVISWIDYDYYIIPDVISLPGTLIAAIIALTNEFTDWFPAPISSGIRESTWGFVAGAGFLWAFSELFYLIRRKEGLGMGDIKLLAMTGILFGPAGAVYTIFLGSVFGSILGLALTVLGGRTFAKPIPFGPYLALGSVLYLFAGDEIMHWWFQTVNFGAPH